MQPLDVSLGMVCGALAVVAGTWLGSAEDEKFEELTVERINVVEADGSLKLVISNGERQTMGVVEGRPLPDRGRWPGLIFFNDLGDEMGGLIFGGDEEGGGEILTFDQFRQDQVMGLTNSERSAGDKRLRETGLVFWDRPETRTIWDDLEDRELFAGLDADEREAEIARRTVENEFTARRMFVGRNDTGEVGIELRDRQGRIRLRLMTTMEGDSRIEFLDEEGAVVRAVTPGD